MHYKVRNSHGAYSAAGLKWARKAICYHSISVHGKSPLKSQTPTAEMFNNRGLVQCKTATYLITVVAKRCPFALWFNEHSFVSLLRLGISATTTTTSWPNNVTSCYSTGSKRLQHTCCLLTNNTEYIDNGHAQIRPPKSASFCIGT